MEKTSSPHCYDRNICSNTSDRDREHTEDLEASLYPGQGAGRAVFLPKQQNRSRKAMFVPQKI